MKIDPNMLKEINKSVDGFVKKNKMALDNARAIDALKKQLTVAATRIVKLENTVKLLEIKVKTNEQYIKIKSDADLEKLMKPIWEKLNKAYK